jgi:hypothetical protein
VFVSQSDSTQLVGRIFYPGVHAPIVVTVQVFSKSARYHDSRGACLS